MEENCANCKFSRPQPTAEGLRCHRNSPMPYKIDEYTRAYWPVITAKDWCGQHQWGDK